MVLYLLFAFCQKDLLLGTPQPSFLFATSFFKKSKVLAVLLRPPTAGSRSSYQDI